jgi:hypothetical protein
MEIIQKYSEWTELNPDAQRQFIDAQSAFRAWEEAVKEAEQVRGGMHWKVQGQYEYLIRTSRTNIQKSLGPRSPETEEIYRKFIERKESSDKRLAGLRATLERHQRMNRALHVGRAPGILIDILARLAGSGLSEHFIVIGTHAIYAYEAAAGVFVSTDAVTTKDVDLLWDTRKRVAFITSMNRLDTHFLGLLKKVDQTFRLLDSDKSKAVNSNGFEVDIIRREAHEGDPNPLKVTEHDEDFYAVQARRAGVLLNGPRFSQMIVSTSGHMARLNTISPAMFVKFKRWMGTMPDRDPQKRSRDLIQADVVERLLDERLPHLSKDM